MLDDFFIRAVLAGIGLAVIAGPLGCFIVWRRMAYFGDTLAHAALLGVALSFLFEVHLTLAIFLVAAAVSISLLALEKLHGFSADAILGMLSHAALALGLVLIALMSWIRVDISAFLFGDILAVSKLDVGVIYGAGAVIIAIILGCWRWLLSATVDADLAQAEGWNPAGAQIVLVFLLAGVVAMAIKIIGVLLIGALLIIPAITARRLASTPEQMAVYAALCGVAATIAGLFGSLQWDTPSGPSIVVSALVVFLLSLVVRALLGKVKANYVND